MSKGQHVFRIGDSRIGVRGVLAGLALCFSTLFTTFLIMAVPVMAATTAEKPILRIEAGQHTASIKQNTADSVHLKLHRTGLWRVPQMNFAWLLTLKEISTPVVRELQILSLSTVWVAQVKLNNL